MQLRCSSALSEGAALPLTLSRRSHGMSAARTLSGSGNQNTREIWCRRRESNDTRLLILRNLLQTYERKNRTTRCMPASYVQNHVQQFEGRVRRRPLNAGLLSSPFRIASRRQRFVGRSTRRGWVPRHAFSAMPLCGFPVRASLPSEPSPH